MENNNNIRLTEIIEKLEYLKSENNKPIVQTSFPYSKQNLKTIKDAVNKISQKTDEYRLTYDENTIFVQKDSFEI